MLIKKLQRIIRDFRYNNKFEVIQKFKFEYRTYFIIRPKSGYIISNRSYVVPEFTYYFKKSGERDRLKLFLAIENKFRGRHYTILC